MDNTLKTSKMTKQHTWLCDITFTLLLCKFFSLTSPQTSVFLILFRFQGDANLRYFSSFSEDMIYAPWKVGGGNPPVFPGVSCYWLPFQESMFPPPEPKLKRSVYCFLLSNSYLMRCAVLGGK